MENIFINLTIPMYYFNFNMSFNISEDLYIYLFDNLFDENNIITWDLKDALTNNANGKYI
jgi:hypothetical protein